MLGKATPTCSTYVTLPIYFFKLKYFPTKYYFSKFKYFSAKHYFSELNFPPTNIIWGEMSWGANVAGGRGMSWRTNVAGGKRRWEKISYTRLIHLKYKECYFYFIFPVTNKININNIISI